MPRTVSSPMSEDVCPDLRVPNRPDAKIALRGVQLRCQISGMSQRTSIYQTFINQEPDAIEAVYTFPLPDGAAVCGFEVVTADRVLTGQIEESEKAIDQYEQAVGQGHGAFLMEQDRPDVFSVRVGNLKSRQAATVRLSYVCALERVDKSIRVAFPTTLAPRFATDTATDPLEAMVDGVALNPPHVLHVPYGLSMEVEIDLGRQLVGVSSPSHAIKVELGDGREGKAAEAIRTTRVTLVGGMTEMNRDIVLNIELGQDHEPCVEAERGKDGASFLAVTFVPEFDVDDLAGSGQGGPAPSETIFVLDCSGSMQGESIRQATAALELCLRGMNEGDTFNICRFGSSFELMASEPLRYAQETLDRAIAYVRGGADMGGTELYGPLEAILRQPPVVGKVRQIVLLTDGQVTNEPACIDLARRNRSRNRVFSFGIGPACSTHLVKGLARATGGAAEFITTGERIDDKVLRTFSRLASPMVSEVSIDWGGAEVQTLAELPPVFDGDVLAVFGRSPGRAPAVVTLSCTTESGPKSWKVAVPPPIEASEQPGVIATMWARRTIQSLEEVNNLAISRSRPAVKSREREMVVSLSREFGLLSSLTTFIAVEHRTVEERNEGRPALRRVPVMLAAGWGGIDVMCAPPQVLAAPCAALYDKDGSAAPATGLYDLTSESALFDECLPGGLMPASASPPMQAPFPVPPPMRERSLLSRLRKSFGPVDAGKKLGPPAPAPAARHTIDKTFDRAVDRSVFHASPPDDGDLKTLLGLQRAEGAFAWSSPTNDHVDDLIRRRGHDPVCWRDMVRAALPSSGGPGWDPERVVQTTLVLSLFALAFQGRGDLLRRARGKAIRYLAATMGKAAHDVEKWLTDLKTKIEAK